MNQARRHSGPAAPARTLWPLLLPLLLCLLVYRGVGSFGFVNFDDDIYVSENPHVTDGLSPAGLGWALTTGHAQVWIPATWLSLQADASLFGAGPAGFHRTNLFLHLAAVALVWLLGRRLTGSVAAATVAAGLWAVHPVNTEAVCWVTARKDTLMAPLMLGAALVWLAATGRARWAGTAALALLAMLAKPAAVIVPLLLLLVSWWRAEAAPAAGAVPRARWRPELAFLGALLAVAAAIAAVTVRLAQGGEMGKPLPVSPLQRLADAVTGVGRYLERLVWPHGLAVRYPDADLRVAPVVAVVLGVAVLAVTVALVRWRRRAPLAAFGWLWFLVCLLPSSGLVQGGQLPMGDRYVYLGAIGLWLAGADALVRATAGRTAARRAALAVAAALTVLAAVAATRQAANWRDAPALWNHALAVTRDNDVAHQNLAVMLDAQGRPQEALAHLDAAIRIRPHSETHFNAGNITASLGRPAEAEAHYRAALKLNPYLYEASLNLGSLLGMQGRYAEAREVLLAAAAKQPNLASIQYNLAVVAWRQGDAAEAGARCRRALELEPGHAGAADLLRRLAAGPG
jgi:protein O-mannosyl-transferase